MLNYELFCGALTKVRCVMMENLEACCCVGCSKKGHIMAQEKTPLTFESESVNDYSPWREKQIK